MTRDAVARIRSKTTGISMLDRIRLRPSYETRAVLILSAVGGVTAIDMLAFNFLSPFIATDLHLGNSEIGLIGGTGLLTWSLGAISSAFWSDRTGRRRIFLIVSLLCFAILSTATALAMSFLTLAVARLLVGLSEGPVVPMQNAIMLAESPLQRRGMNMGIVQNFGSQLLGGVAGPLILVALATKLGWRDAFLISAAPALLMAAVVRWGIREPLRIDEPTHRPLFAQSIRAIVSTRNLRLCFLIGTCGVGWLATTTIFVPLWMIRTLHFGPGAMSVVLACLGIGGAAASVLVPALSDRLGRLPVLVGFALVGLILPLGMLFVSADLATIASTVLIGSLFTGIFPLFIGVIPMESVDASQGATASSIVMGCAQIAGSFLGPLLAGVLADHLSPAAPFWLATGLAVGAAAIGFNLTETAPSRRSVKLQLLAESSSTKLI